MPPTPCGAGIILRRHPEPSRRPLITLRPLAGRCSALGRSCLMPSSPPGASDSRPSRPNHGGAAAGLRRPAPQGAPPIRRPRATGAPPACLLAVQRPGRDASGRESPLSAAFGVAAVAVDRIGAHRTYPWTGRSRAARPEPSRRPLTPRSLAGRRRAPEQPRRAPHQACVRYSRTTRQTAPWSKCARPHEVRRLSAARDPPHQSAAPPACLLALQRPAYTRWAAIPHLGRPRSRRGGRG